MVTHFFPSLRDSSRSRFLGGGEVAQAIMRILSASYLPEADDSLIADDITGVQGRFRFDQFDQDDVHFVFGYRQMADATGDNYEFSGADPKLALARLYN